MSDASFQRTHPRGRGRFGLAVRQNRTASGFTLLEVLIVGILTSLLMLGIWSLFRTWSRLYERGERRVHAAQLVRSLCDQFTDDVRSVAYVAPPRQRGPSRCGDWGMSCKPRRLYPAPRDEFPRYR